LPDFPYYINSDNAALWRIFVKRIDINNDWLITSRLDVALALAMLTSTA